MRRYFFVCFVFCFVFEGHFSALATVVGMRTVSYRLLGFTNGFVCVVCHVYRVCSSCFSRFYLKLYVFSFFHICLDLSILFSPFLSLSSSKRKKNMGKTTQTKKETQPTSEMRFTEEIGTPSSAMCVLTKQQRRNVSAL